VNGLSPFFRCSSGFRPADPEPADALARGGELDRAANGADIGEVVIALQIGAHAGRRRVLGAVKASSACGIVGFSSVQR